MAHEDGSKTCNMNKNWTFVDLQYWNVVTFFSVFILRHY